MLKRLKILQLRLKTLLRLFEHYMNVDDENVEVVHSVGTSINEDVNI
jgi:hypothetical protein